jgi:EAL domain-containing protein (putative c-di-GMP-specific phosphodiesterase class I)
MNVLLIDDDPFALEVLNCQLSELGFENIIQCDSAKTALGRLKNEETAQVDLLFCDLQMPQMDGIEFVRELARVGYLGRLALVSGEDHRILRTAENLAKAYKLHVLGALSKPVSPAQLDHLINGNARQLDSAPKYSAAQLQQAIEEGQLQNHYQPRVDLATGALVGFEAQPRWQHPTDGLLAPDQFIGIAEQHGLIKAVTRAVLRSALGQAGIWHAKGMALKIAVSISIEDLAALNFPNLIEREASFAGVPLNHIVLEVKERGLLQDSIVPLDILTRLRLKRIGLSIADFSTFRASLTQLCDVAFTEVKIDPDFVHEATNDLHFKGILEANLGQARQRGLLAVADGIDSAESWHTLQVCGYDLAQGNFIGAPMAAADVAEWMEGWKDRRPALADDAVAVH